ncbi:lipid-A-disaccharide synthase N-terminal domain-containing protein [Rhodobacteraceae bacterium N5(2021)]|uniref:Lipid-A-disaccharide synthase N-terminal domain-containing protein n=1 Tax=Gymnodinialimonas phycosphaerae TaxID=2841589 RepID=A0A975TVV7_9RHOB|nr:lipid-A-disaccharide synthase N-terminal domain-containing protein [Gymnodinialimonas phycosphaerae]MBY4891346.1 lipid-A-disaccharide synthase N-terminal domain-containing protein [Gymnodinialimonas phycosphaerae]
MEDWLFGFLNIDNWFEFWWVALGFLAQGIFASRFIVQWIASEKAGRSYVPVAFWYLSISGGLLMLAYAIYRQDPVFILGQSTGVIVYARNLVLIHRNKHAGPDDAVHDQT